MISIALNDTAILSINSGNYYCIVDGIRKSDMFFYKNNKLLEKYN